MHANQLLTISNNLHPSLFCILYCNYTPQIYANLTSTKSQRHRGVRNEGFRCVPCDRGFNLRLSRCHDTSVEVYFWRKAQGVLQVLNQQKPGRDPSFKIKKSPSLQEKGGSQLPNCKDAQPGPTCPPRCQGSPFG